MFQFFEWVKRKGRWAIGHNINPRIFLLIYLSGIVSSFFGTAILSYGLSINSSSIWTLGVVAKLVGMATPGLYVVVMGKKLDWRVKPIILLIIITSIAFFTWRVPSRIRELIFWLIGVTK